MKSTLLLAILLTTTAVGAQNRATSAASTPRADAPIDLTGQWVAIVSEDWRWRMITPPKGDIVSIPLNLQGQQTAEAWDPAKDEAAGEQCKAYGAPGLMRGPIRMRISWQDDKTLKLETDYGMQTRLLRFDTATSPGPRSWQGFTSAQWIIRGGGRGAARYGSLKTVTNNLRPGYLRKNGVPYSERAQFTEHWDVHSLPNGDKYLVNTNIVEDPVYLQAPFQTAIHYKLERDTSSGSSPPNEPRSQQASDRSAAAATTERPAQTSTPQSMKWDPTPCDARF